MFKRTSFVAIVGLVFCLDAQAQVTIPNVFVSGQPATAAAVNANFSALVTAINSQGVRLAKLEERTAMAAIDVAGAYTLNGLQVEVSTNHIATYTQKGTVTLNADGTFTWTTSANGWEISLINPIPIANGVGTLRPTLIPFSSQNNTNSGTWTVNSANEISIVSGSFTLKWTASPGLAIATTSGTDVQPTYANGTATLLTVMRHP